MPKFDRQLNVYWESQDRIFDDGTGILNFTFDRFAAILRNEADQRVRAVTSNVIMRFRRYS